MVALPNLSRGESNPLKQDVAGIIRIIRKMIPGDTIPPSVIEAMKDLPQADAQAVGRMLESQIKLGKQNALGFSTAGKTSLEKGGRQMFPNQESYAIYQDNVLHPSSSRRALESDGENAMGIKKRDLNEKLGPHRENYDYFANQQNPKDPKLNNTYMTHNHPTGNTQRSGTANPLSPADVRMYGNDRTTDQFITETPRTFERGPVKTGNKYTTSRGVVKDEMAVPNHWTDDDFGFSTRFEGDEAEQLLKAQEAGLAGEASDTWQGILDKYEFPNAKNASMSPQDEYDFNNIIEEIYKTDTPADGEIRKRLQGDHSNTSANQRGASALRGEIMALSDNFGNGRHMDFTTYAEEDGVADMIQQAYEYYTGLNKGYLKGK